MARYNIVLSDNEISLLILALATLSFDSAFTYRERECNELSKRLRVESGDNVESIIEYQGDCCGNCDYHEIDRGLDGVCDMPESEFFGDDMENVNRACKYFRNKNRS